MSALDSASLVLFGAAVVWLGVYLGLAYDEFRREGDE